MQMSKKQTEERIEKSKLAKITPPKQKNHTSKMLGLGREIWNGINPLVYIRNQRAEWDKM